VVWNTGDFAPTVIDSSATDALGRILSGDGTVAAGTVQAGAETPAIWLEFGGGVWFELPLDPTAFYGRPRSINHDGTVVVGEATPATHLGGSTDAFVWTAGGMQYLGLSAPADPPSSSAQALAVSDDGRHVLGSSGNIGTFHWSPAGGAVPLDTILAAPLSTIPAFGGGAPAGASVVEVFDISSDGRTAFIGVKPAGWPAPLPDLYVATIPQPEVVLSASADQIDLTTGGTVTLTHDAGVAHAGDLFWTLGTVSGTYPGMAGPGSITIPTNYDGFMQNFYLTNPNTFVIPTAGLLNGAGQAVSSFGLPGATFPSLAGIDIWHAYIVWDLGLGAITAASNPALCRLVL
jgi:uncharacterized membrane protein